MRRIRITLQEKKRGWIWIRQTWETPYGFSHKAETRSSCIYATPAEALESLCGLQFHEDKEIYPSHKAGNYPVSQESFTPANHVD
jgi:hypothetical protein